MASAASRSGQASISRAMVGEGIVERRHEDAAHGVDDERALAGLGVDERRTAAGRASRKIGGPDQPRRALDEHQRLALIPGVVAERDGIGAGVDQFLIDRLGDAESARGILAIDDDEVERPVAHETRQMLADCGAS